MSNKVYQIITDRIIEHLEKGTAPWHKPWKVLKHKNMTSKKAYRGLNIFMLEMTASDQGYSSNYWVTFKQAQKKGGKVRKGEKATPVIFWKWIEKEREDGEIDSFPILRYYSVFNVEQVNWPDDFEIPIDQIADDFDPIEEAQAIIDEMQNAPEITHGGSRACYRPSSDKVSMPQPETFEENAEYYSVAFHELTHSTGHPSRLGRFDLEASLASFGTPDYSKEELIAEMGAAMLCGACGIEASTIKNSAAYIASWLKVLKGDNRFVIHAAAQAQKSSDYIQNVEYN